MNSNSIAIVGMACVYPDAKSSGELWENVLAQRRAFRQMPAERLRMEDYLSADKNEPDKTYAMNAAVIEGYEFDRVAFKVVGSTFRAADLAHWLALDVASRALADAGFAERNNLPSEMTGVLLGNTLTGEFSRANTLRLRWPYVRRTVEAALAKENFSAEQREKFLSELEEKYKAPFPPVGEETLAGGLSNTIAGRICNHFNLKGGGYTVDGACASSLLAVANGCSSLVARDLDVVVAGGVDLSLDPFEIVGFAKTGALALDEMRIFEKRSGGFIPGEGCGLVVLMRHEDAIAQGRRVYAAIRGWGISSDGAGGMTRPEAEGQLEALRRAYRRAGFGAETVSYCEGHGTGTAVGDATELEVLSRIRRESKNDFRPAAIGSIKANIGHTKAAAGIAGLIKATMAVHTQVLPPTTGCEQAHAQLAGPSPALRVLREAEPWPQDCPLRASVSAMGFGGINAHVVLESTMVGRRAALTAREISLSRTVQDAELFLFAAASPKNLLEQVEKALAFAAKISRAEMTDLAAQLEKSLGAPDSKIRASVVASKPSELSEKLQTLQTWLRDGVIARLDFAEEIFLGSAGTAPRIAFLFPGQGSPTHLDGGVWRRRFESVRELYSRAELPTEGDTVSTRVMQPAVVTASLAGMKVLEEFGVTADAAIGHSLGEISALHWAGAFDADALLRVARVRGAAMADLGSPTGSMLAIAAPWTDVQPLLKNDSASIVGYNSPRQTVVAGETAAVKQIAELARARGWQASMLPVSHAFHTPLVAAAAPVLGVEIGVEKFSPLQRKVFSTVTGGLLDFDCDLRELLCTQVTAPVRFTNALAAMDGGADLLIEVGPGAVLAGLVRDGGEIPIVSLDAGGNSLSGLLSALGTAFALGAPVKTNALFANRFTRPFALDRKFKFFASPCEQAPVSEVPERLAPARLVSDEKVEAEKVHQRAERVLRAPLELIRQLVAERAELPVSAVRDDSRMLSDLHLNSITVGQLVSTAAKQLNLPRLSAVTEFANASVAEIARTLEQLTQTSIGIEKIEERKVPAGIGSWVRAFSVDWIETPLRDVTKKISGMSVNAGWQLFATENNPQADELREALAKTGTQGVVIWLPKNPGEETISKLLAAGRAVMALKDAPKFLVVQHGWGGSGFAKTLHLENPHIAVCVVNVGAPGADVVEQIVAEVKAANGFTEVLLDGRRFEPRLVLAEGQGIKETGATLNKDDVLLVTGGGRGIAAECALALARQTGVKLALMGRGDPKTDKELSENFARIAAAGVRFNYVPADVTDAKAVLAAVKKIESELGPVTGILHGAGVNTPQLISALDEAAFRKTVTPKISGLKNVLAAVDEKKLKLLTTFGSIIARSGLPGEADYATANEWLAALTNEFQKKYPQCHCLTLEWSVWSGAGMGERLGRIETLAQQGIAAISVDEGVKIFCKLVREKTTANSLVVTGRFGELATLKLAGAELPLQRFLERKRVLYPGVELIVDTELSLQSDPYLADHVVQKQSLLPAVVGLEAMAQAAMALVGSEKLPVFEKAEFLRPVVVPAEGKTTLRLAALRRTDGAVEVCLRSEETGFQTDHFRVVCQFGEQGADNKNSRWGINADQNIALAPQDDLYGKILFHTGRFQRVQSYRLLKAKECIAEISADHSSPWFGPYVPGEILLGNPAARDAALHSIQACIPHRRILPTGIEQITVFKNETGVRFVHALECSRDGNNFVFDVEVTNALGEVLERWHGLQLRAVEMLPTTDMAAALVAPYLERRLEEIVNSDGVNVAFEERAGERPAKTDVVISKALGRDETIWRRPDGRPVVTNGENVSAAHAGDFILAMSGTEEVACDLEKVSGRSKIEWRELLGEDKISLISRLALEQNESLDAAATRVWSALECLKKIGLPASSPLMFEAKMDDGWMVLRSGITIIATGLVQLRDAEWDLMAALVRQPQETAKNFTETTAPRETQPA